MSEFRPSLCLETFGCAVVAIIPADASRSRLYLDILGSDVAASSSDGICSSYGVVECRLSLCLETLECDDAAILPDDSCCSYGVVECRLSLC